MTHHVLDTVVVSIASILSASVPLLLADDSTPAEHLMEMQLLLLPLIGAILVSGGFIMLNPQPETRRIVIGRSFFSLFLGALVPQVVGWFVAWVHPTLAPFVARPVSLLLLGGIISGVVYVLSRPFVSGMYDRAEGEARAQLDRLQEQLHPVTRETTTITRETPVAATVAELPSTQTVTTTTVNQTKPLRP